MPSTQAGRFKISLWWLTRRAGILFVGWRNERLIDQYTMAQWLMLRVIKAEAHESHEHVNVFNLGWRKTNYDSSDFCRKSTMQIFSDDFKKYKKSIK
jgi:hypothetical protein